MMMMKAGLTHSLDEGGRGGFWGGVCPNPRRVFTRHAIPTTTCISFTYECRSVEHTGEEGTPAFLSHMNAAAWSTQGRKEPPKKAFNFLSPFCFEKFEVDEEGSIFYVPTASLVWFGSVAHGLRSSVERGSVSLCCLPCCLLSSNGRSGATNLAFPTRNLRPDCPLARSS